MPVALSTSSARSLWASSKDSPELSGLKTSWTIPVRSRRSMKIRPPWSRRRLTQPATRTSESTRSGSTCAAPGVAVAVGAQRRRLGLDRRPPPVISSTRLPGSAGRCSPLSMSRSWALPSASRMRTRRAPIRSACLSWPLRPRPARSTSAESPAWRSSTASAIARCALARVGDRDEGVAPGRRLLFVQRQQDPLDPGGEADRRRRRRRRAARSGRRSGRRRRSPTAPRARRRRRRRSSACSSRGRGPGSGRRRRRCRPRRAAPAPRRSARRPRPRAARRSSARSPSPPASPRRRSRRRAAG